VCVLSLGARRRRQVSIRLPLPLRCRSVQRAIPSVSPGRSKRPDNGADPSLSGSLSGLCAKSLLLRDSAHLVCDSHQGQAIADYGATTFTLNSVEVDSPVSGVPFT
jgi:hypothetical protein